MFFGFRRLSRASCFAVQRHPASALQLQYSPLREILLLPVVFCCCNTTTLHWHLANAAAQELFGGFFRYPSRTSRRTQSMPRRSVYYACDSCSRELPRWRASTEEHRQLPITALSLLSRASECHLSPDSSLHMYRIHFEQARAAHLCIFLFVAAMLCAIAAAAYPGIVFNGFSPSLSLILSV